MPHIRPSSDVRNNYPEISRLAKETKEPIYLTVNGKGDTAIIDIQTLDELYQRIELYRQLSEGLEDFRNGHVSTHEEIFGRFRKE